MTVSLPSLNQLHDLAGEIGLDITDIELEEIREVMAPLMSSLDWVQSEPDGPPPVKYSRTPGYEPAGDDNEFNAWARKTDVQGAPDGRLQGRKVVLKDNIALAGVPMANGASTLSFYSPDFDATVATRILESGGNIAGKAQCEFMSFTGNSHSSYKQLKVQNPYRDGLTSGGSSSGCGALVGGGVVDLAIGADQGGSIRIPAAWCGCCGLKPTYGLVPYTGCAPLEMTLDHVGPMTATVADNALLLEIIAGADGLDPRQRDIDIDQYTKALGAPVKELRIGMLKEGFGHANSDPQVDDKVRQAADTFRTLGAAVIEVTVPAQLDVQRVWFPIAYQGAFDLVMQGNGIGSNWLGYYATSLADAQHMWRLRQHELSATVRFVALLGGFLKKHHRGQLYGRAQNIRRRITADFDRVFDEVDLLLMPTTPFTAPPIAAPDCTMAENLEASGAMANNTLAANLTRHPAMSVPCGMVDGLPVGMMLVGRHWQESMIYRAAHAFEQDDDWRTR